MAPANGERGRVESVMWEIVAGARLETHATGIGVVSREGSGEPITLTLSGPDGEVGIPLTPVRALELVKDLSEPAVRSIKTEQWGAGWPG